MCVKLEGKILLLRHKRKCEGNIKMDLQEIQGEHKVFPDYKQMFTWT